MNQDTIPSQLNPVTIPSKLGPAGPSSRAPALVDSSPVLKWLLLAVMVGLLAYLVT